MSEIKVSVIIPTYNVEKYIEECICSVQKQDLRKIEIICVDDHSTDDTVEIIKGLMINDNRIKLIELGENGGPARARNIGSKKAKGKYIHFLDSDDYVKEGMYSKLYSISEKNDLDVLSFSGEAFVDKEFSRGSKYEVNRNLYKRKNEFIGVFSGPELFVEYIKREEKNGNLCLQFIKHELYKSKNLYADEQTAWFDDSPFGIYMYAKKAMCISDIFYMRRYRSNSIITSSNKRIDDFAIGFFNELQLWQKIDLPERINNTIEKYFIMHYRTLYSLCKRNKAEYALQGKLEKYPMISFIIKYCICRESRYPDFTDQIICELNNAYCVVLYGTGIIAEEVADYLEEIGIDKYIPVVTKKESSYSFRDKEVFEADQLQIEWGKTWVIVAVSSKYRNEIIDYLNAKNPLEILTV